MLTLVRRNWLLLASLIIAGIIVGEFVCPYLNDRGHPLVCVPLFAVLVLIFIYARHHAEPVAKTKARRQRPGLQ